MTTVRTLVEYVSETLAEVVRADIEDHDEQTDESADVLALAMVRWKEANEMLERELWTRRGIRPRYDAARTSSTGAPK